MKFIILATLTLLFCSTAFASDPIKLEGTCTGKLTDGTSVSYTYSSDYDGCQKISQATIAFTSGFKGKFVGKRSFTDTQDIYNLKGGYKLIFANSTGNTMGTLTYPGNKTIKVQCETRDYEYGDCSNSH